MATDSYTIKRDVTSALVLTRFGIATFREAGVAPFAPDGRDFGSLYLRSEAAPLFARA